MISVYIVKDTGMDEIISIHASKAGAQAAVLDHLEDADILEEYWEEVAKSNGYDTVDDFKAMLRQVPSYNDEFYMEVTEQVVLP